MIFNQLGDMVNKYWKDIPNHFSNIELDYYVIMPNHIHGIIIINPVYEQKQNYNNNIVETPHGASLQHGIKNIKTTLGIIINQFKSSFKRWCNNNGYDYFKWQERFYDRIIRNEKELYNIRKYIDQNPLRWSLERNTPVNLTI